MEQNPSVRRHKLQEMLQQEHRRLLALQAISSRINAIFDLDQLADELAQSIKTMLGYYNALIYLMDEEGEEVHLKASGRPLPTHLRDRRRPLTEEELLCEVAQSRMPLLIPDVRQRSCVVSSADVTMAIVTPMLVGGRLVGFIQVESDRPDALGRDDIQTMVSLANQVSASVEAARLLRKSRANAAALAKWARNLMVINRIATAVAFSLDRDEILNITIQQLVELIGMDYGSAVILEEESLGVVAAEHPDRGCIGHRLSLPRQVLSQPMLKTGTPHVIEDAQRHPILLALREWSPSLEARMALLAPLLARGDLVGVLLLASVNPRTLSESEIEICQTVASQAAVAIANVQLLHDLQQQREALARESQELAAETSKLDAILRSVADGLVVIDLEGRIVLSNPAFHELANVPASRSLHGRPLKKAFSAPNLQTLAEQAFQSPDQVFTENLRLSDGRVLKTLATALRLPPSAQGEKDQVAGAVLVLRDITREVEVDRMKTDFISAVSHELRSPLTSILGFTNLIQRDFRRRVAPHLGSDEKIRQVADRILHNLTIIENESLRLTRLINDMLDIAKMEAGRMEWRKEKVNLATVITQAVNAITALAEGKRLAIQVYMPPEGLPDIVGDRDRFVQVMTNLLGNAIKFTAEGQVEVRGWELEVKEGAFHRKGPVPPAYGPAEHDRLASLHFSDGDWVVVSVTDTGVGIRPEDLPHVFEKFRKVRDAVTEHISGTGLGLSICKEIVEHHEGRIWAESAPGVGSTFSFAVPVKPTPDENTA